MGASRPTFTFVPAKRGTLGSMSSGPYSRGGTNARLSTSSASTICSSLDSNLNVVQVVETSRLREGIVSRFRPSRGGSKPRRRLMRKPLPLTTICPTAGRFLKK